MLAETKTSQIPIQHLQIELLNLDFRYLKYQISVFKVFKYQYQIRIQHLLTDYCANFQANLTRF